MHINVFFSIILREQRRRFSRIGPSVTRVVSDRSRAVSDAQTDRGRKRRV